MTKTQSSLDITLFVHFSFLVVGQDILLKVQSEVLRTGQQQWPRTTAWPEMCSYLKVVHDSHTSLYT